MRTFMKYIMLIFVVAALSACAPVAVVQQKRYLWPSPPNTPRIEWLGAYSNQLDFKMTQSRRIKELIVGEDAPISLKKPIEVRSDSERDKLYIVDSEAGGVYVYDLGQSQVRMLSMADAGLPERIGPSGLALDSEGSLYLLEPRHLKVVVFDSSEKYVRTISLRNFCSRPIAIAIDKGRGRIYVSDVQLNKIFVFDLSGAWLFSFGDSGSNEGSFNKPVAIAIARNGDVIVADAFNARIQIFSESGAFRKAFGKRGDGLGNFQLIKSVAVDPDDNIYVVDGRSHLINIFNSSGDLLFVFGGFYSVSTSGKIAPGGLALPVGIDIDSLGRIFIADQLNSRVQFFQYLPDNATVAPAQLNNQAK